MPTVPCTASAVIRAMLVKVGRPHSEVEHAVAETAEREAERAFANVRWLNLCTGVTPLMGLLGTVWGMIIAFHQTTLLAPGQDRATQLAEGIYIALVTTLGGLMVAIPAAILAHFFERRIVALFHEIDEMLFNLMPLVERYEGRVGLVPGRPATSRRDRAAAGTRRPRESERYADLVSGRRATLGNQLMAVRIKKGSTSGRPEHDADHRRRVSAVAVLPGGHAFCRGGPRAGCDAAGGQRSQTADRPSRRNCSSTSITRGSTSSRASLSGDEVAQILRQAAADNPATSPSSSAQTNAYNWTRRCL